MKSVRSIFIGLTCLGMATASFAQEKETTPEATTYKAEIFGSVASGDNTPFWMVSNRYGFVPLEANYGYLNAGVFHNQTFGKGFRTNNKQTYVDNVLWHHKSLFVQIKDTRNDFPLSGVIGVQHWAQWGGTSTNPKIGKQPQSIKDLIRVICGSEGGGDATVSDQINVLGNHYGSYDFKLAFTQPNWQVSAYYQHFFEDKSGMIFVNNTDGLWGGQLDLPKFPWLRKVVVEYLVTRDQSGQFHFIDFDHDLHPGVGGGGDDYYNNGEYTTGASYFNRAIGSPLVPSPEYNENGSLGFKNNRVRDWHFGAEGAISSQVSYRVLVTVMNSWGRHATPFLSKKRGASGLLDISYQHPRLSGWEFTGSLAADAGSMFGDNFGFSLKVAKRGILKSWK